jgi:hypothetical protein
MIIPGGILLVSDGIINETNAVLFWQTGMYCADFLVLPVL